MNQEGILYLVTYIIFLRLGLCHAGFGKIIHARVFHQSSKDIGETHKNVDVQRCGV